MGNPNRLFRQSAVALALTMSVSVHAYAQEAQLTRIAAGLARNGYHEADRKTGSLAEGNASVLHVWLSRGVDYSIRGTCDNDCMDLDLELIAPDGTRMDGDFLPDDVPVVEVRPAQSGYYRIRVAMATCHIAPCQYAVGVFRR